MCEVAARLRCAEGWPATTRARTVSQSGSRGEQEPDMQGSAEDLLKTYPGERAAERVLAGKTKRGEGEKTHAVIWLCDLRDC